MGPIAANLSAFRNILRLKTRATRSEYWWVFATLIGGVITATLIDTIFFPETPEQSALYGFLALLFIIFYMLWLLLTLSVTIRRLRDLDMSAWYLLIYCVPLGLGFVFMAIICSRRGTLGPNRFGPDPFYVDVFSDVEEFG